jgi:Flp pilus assembly protein TadG
MNIYHPSHNVRSRRTQAGSNLVEYAFVLTIFLMMIFGIIDFSRALYSYHYLSNAARDATRWAAVNGYTCNSDSSCNGTGGMNSGPASATQIQTYVTNHIAPALDSTKLTPTATFTHDANSPTICTSAVSGLGGPYNNYPGCTVTVQVSYDFSFLTPLVSNKTLTLSSTSEMVIAH